MKILLLYFFLLFCAFTCSDPDNNWKLRFINTADKPVLVYYTTDWEIAYMNHANGTPLYNPFHEFQEADTTRGYQRGLMRDNPNYIASCNTIYARLSQGHWENHIGDSKFWVYLFDPDVVLANDWDTLWTGKKWSKAYSFTLKQVEARNWILRL